MNKRTPSVEMDKALGQSEAFLAVQEQISRAARTERSVILIGERGTGKELAAARLHFLSQRWNQPYVTINCASLTESLIESELFGHEAGAFTGATRLRKGRFEIANGGTLFLDEIATLPLTVQEKILRVVEYGTMERVGSSETQRVDVRLVAATNVDLRVPAREGRFRQDLLDRLSFEVIVLPPLRARADDILPLARHFARRMAVEMGLEEPPAFTPEIETRLLEYSWPGNIRELKNVVERMVYRAEGAVLQQVVFDPFDGGQPYMPSTPSTGPVCAASAGASAASPAGALPVRLLEVPLPDAVRRLEMERVQLALEEARHNNRRAAEKLGITYDQLRACLRRHRRHEGEP